jgi:TetR/AcrR family transcriptional repressor for divergent bdcA
MVTTKISKVRGRPRRFDPDEAVTIAQQLFHANGYDAVSVADITEALGINPPSFYSAFGSKTGLYTLVLDRWATTGAVPLKDILRSDRPVAEALAEVLEEAARRYASDSATGCLVLESTRCNDAQVRETALACTIAAETVIRDYISERHPAAAASVTDYISTTMSGLSAKARNGSNLTRLLATARLASSVLEQALST